MKKLFYWLTVCSAVFCIHTSMANPLEKSEESEEGKPIPMNLQDFQAKVYNPFLNPDQWVYVGDKPCIIDFYAEWCGPCRRLSPVLEELAQLYAGDIYVYKVNVDHNKELASMFQISSIPTLLWVPMDGKPSLQAGAGDKKALMEMIDKLLLKKE